MSAFHALRTLERNADCISVPNLNPNIEVRRSRVLRFKHSTFLVPSSGCRPKRETSLMVMYLLPFEAQR